MNLKRTNGQNFWRFIEITSLQFKSDKRVQRQTGYITIFQHYSRKETTLKLYYYRIVLWNTSLLLYSRVGLIRLERQSRDQHKLFTYI